MAQREELEPSRGFGDPLVAEDEAYLVLGRLNHVRREHEERRSSLQRDLDSFLHAGYEGARERLERERRSLLGEVELLYQKSLSDLEMHRRSLQEPSESLLGVIKGQIQAVDRSVSSIKSVLAEKESDKERECVLRQAVVDAIAVLAAAASMDKMDSSSNSRLSPPSSRFHLESLPISRLRYATIDLGEDFTRASRNPFQACICPPGCQCKGCRRRRRDGSGSTASRKPMLEVCSCLPNPSFSELKRAYEILYKEATRMKQKLKLRDHKRTSDTSSSKLIALETLLQNSKSHLETEKEEFAKYRKDSQLQVDHLMQKLAKMTQKVEWAENRCAELEKMHLKDLHSSQTFRQEANIQRKLVADLAQRVRDLQHEQAAMAVTAKQQQQQLLLQRHQQQYYPPADLTRTNFNYTQPALNELEKLKMEREELRKQILKLRNEKRPAVKSQRKATKLRRNGSQDNSYAPTSSLSALDDTSIILDCDYESDASASVVETLLSSPSTSASFEWK